MNSIHRLVSITMCFQFIVKTMDHEMGKILQYKLNLGSSRSPHQHTGRTIKREQNGSAHFVFDGAYMPMKMGNENENP